MIYCFKVYYHVRENTFYWKTFNARRDTCSLRKKSAWLAYNTGIGGHLSQQEARLAPSQIIVNRLRKFLIYFTIWDSCRCQNISCRFWSFTFSPNIKPFSSVLLKGNSLSKTKKTGRHIQWASLSCKQIIFSTRKRMFSRYFWIILCRRTESDT